MIKLNDENTAFLTLYVNDFDSASRTIWENDIFNYTQIYIAKLNNNQIVLSIKIKEKKPFLFWKESNLKDNINKLSNIFILLKDYVSVSHIDIDDSLFFELFLVKRLSFQETINIFKFELARKRIESGNWQEYSGDGELPPHILNNLPPSDSIAFYIKKLQITDNTTLHDLIRYNNLGIIQAKDCVLVHENMPLNSYIF